MPAPFQQMRDPDSFEGRDIREALLGVAIGCGFLLGVLAVYCIAGGPS